MGRLFRADRYKKDDNARQCRNKTNVNKILVRFVKPGDRCVILDGRKCKSTQTVINKIPNVAKIDIPNFTDAVYDIKKRYANNDTVEATPLALYDFVSSVPARPYDVMYLDTCGHFTTSKQDDLKSSIDVILKRGLLKRDGGIIGTTVCKRGSTGQWESCDEYFNKRTFEKMTEVTYGTMKTTFYKHKSIHSCPDMVWDKIGGNTDVTCDECSKKMEPYNVVYCCPKCEYDICAICYNELNS